MLVSSVLVCVMLNMCSALMDNRTSVATIDDDNFVYILDQKFGQTFLPSFQ